ncbi:Vacuolar import and degradation protein 27 [Coemansia sp. RSA 988]|nr:Vacuolar import and degradation protein 27 [Coemansia sp. RSA 988]
MNALKSLGKLVWGGKDCPEMFKLSSGVLYELRPTAKVVRKCLYKDCELSIRQTTIAHQYQLVATCVFDEGEDDLIDVLDDERAFLIGTELRFVSTTFEGAGGFRWQDESAGLEYEYIVDSQLINRLTRDAFALAIARCAWGRANSKPYTQASEKDIAHIMQKAEDEDIDRMLAQVKIEDEDVGAATAVRPKPSTAKASTSKDAPTATTASAVVPPKWELPPEPSEMAVGEAIVSTLGELYLFDARNGEFVQVANEVALSVVETEAYTYWMNVASNERSYSSQQIEPEMNAIFNHDHGSLIWNYFDDNRAYSFSVVAADSKHYEALHQGMTRAAYETLNREPWAKATVSSQDYMLDAYEEDVDMLPVPESWDSDDEIFSDEVLPDTENQGKSAHQIAESESDDHSDNGSDSSSSSSDSEEEDEIDQIFRKEPVPQGVKTTRVEVDDSSSEESESESESESEESDGESAVSGDSDSEGVKRLADGSAVNSKLAVGYKHGRSFVVRGSQIGVFKHTDGDDIVFDTTINRVDDTHGREFTPSSVLLHEQDSSLVLMDRQRPNDLYKMDLEYGKVVEEWRVHEDIPTLAVAPNTKFSQMTGEKTLVGLSHNMLYRIDPRLGGDNQIFQNEQKAYATKNGFTSAATTDSGAVAVGSSKGDIRLFDRLGVRAKTALPALGEAILGIDVTSDGRYVVATCKTYLLLIDTKVADDSAGRTGFERSFPQAKKPAPKRLQLKPEHVVYMGAPISFTPAKFNQSPDGNSSEKTIVTSTGPFVITWNLRRVLGTGRGDAYHIKQYPDIVVADNFRFGQDKSIVVTLPNDVQSVRRSQLAKPTRESLMVRPSGSGGLLSSRDNIVDAPY